MNRYLAIPSAMSLVLFVGLLAKSSFGVSSNSTAPTSVEAATYVSAPLRIEDAEIAVLDQWPTLSEFQWGSRRGPTQSLYATLDLRMTQTSFLGRMGVTARHAKPETTTDVKNGRSTFPIHVDRSTGDVLIFADYQWQDYPTWRDQNLPQYLEVTGWNADAAG